MLNSDGNISLQEAAQATLAGVPSAAVMGAPTVNNKLATTRFNVVNVVNVNAGVVDAELRSRQGKRQSSRRSGSEVCMSARPQSHLQQQKLQQSQPFREFSNRLNNMFSTRTMLQQGDCRKHCVRLEVLETRSPS